MLAKKKKKKLLLHFCCNALCENESTLFGKVVGGRGATNIVNIVTHRLECYPDKNSKTAINSFLSFY